MTKRLIGQKQPLLYVYALTYQAPEDSSDNGDNHIRSGEYAYYSPRGSIDHERWAERALCVRERFLYTRVPLSWQELEAAKLVPANSRTRLQLALAYDQQTCWETPMVWTTRRGFGEDGGKLLAWYAEASLWGATSFSAREGRMGTIFARQRESLVEAALCQGYIPQALLLDRVRGLPGMHAGAIHPVFLNVESEQSLLQTYIQACDVLGVTNRDPWLVADGWLPEWIVSLLCQERHMAFAYASSTLPTVEQVLGQVLSVASSLEWHPGREEWMRAKENDAEAIPYEVCLRQAQEVKELLGIAYREFMDAFHQSEVSHDR